MTNDYAALVAMLDQAAADLQAEIDAAIDRHAAICRLADQLRAKVGEERVSPAAPIGVEMVTRGCHLITGGWPE